MESYLALVPSELVTLIAYNLNTDDIKSIIKADITHGIMDRIIKNKYFWINKASYDNIGKEYLILLDLVEINDIVVMNYEINKGDYINAYSKIKNLEFDISVIFDGVLIFRGTINLDLKRGTMLKDLIETNDLKKVSSMIEPKDGKKCQIWWNWHRFMYNCGSHDEHDQINLITESDYLSTEDFITLCIKLELSGYNLIKSMSI